MRKDGGWEEVEREGGRQKTLQCPLTSSKLGSSCQSHSIFADADEELSLDLCLLLVLSTEANNPVTGTPTQP